MAGQFRIGEVAERTELSINTIRHYDEAGLVTPSARSSGGFRLYAESDIERLMVIRRMKPLGFSLDEMRELLAALDTLGARADDATAMSYVAECHRRALQSCSKLRKQLAYAEELTDLLARRSEGPTRELSARPVRPIQ